MSDAHRSVLDSVVDRGVFKVITAVLRAGMQ
jgi:hypothetical protein